LGGGCEGHAVACSEVVRDLPRYSNAEINRKRKRERVDQEKRGSAACAGKRDVCFALDDDARGVAGLRLAAGGGGGGGMRREGRGLWEFRPLILQ